MPVFRRRRARRLLQIARMLRELDALLGDTAHR
jgi:hypothetical protein